MFKEVASSFVNSLYNKVGSETVGFAKKIVKPAAVAGSLYTVAHVGSQLAGKISAYGSHMVGVGSCDKVNYLSNKFVYEGSIKELNDYVTEHYGTSVSQELGKWLLEHGNKILGDINRTGDWLKNNCGESQQFLDSLGRLQQNIYDSLALYGTEPSKVPFFSSYLTVALERTGSYFSNGLGSLGSYLGDNLSHIVSRTAETSSGAGDSGIVMALLMGLSTSFTIYAGRKLNKSNKESSDKR